nr:PhnD/SsuA/transferrin family substrate-binding protein [Novosphingobium flavum]
MADLPAALDFAAKPVPDAIAADVLLTQTCGYPLQKAYVGQFRLLAVADYDAPGCTDFTHRAFVLVRADEPREGAESLRGARFGYNSLLSNSGMNLPRALFAPLARDGHFFGEVIETGSHPASIAALRGGEVDAVSVDCLTWAFASEHDPAAVSGLRVLCETGPSPAIPFVTSAATSGADAAALVRALVRFGSDPAQADLRRALKIKAVAPARPETYAALLGIEEEAARLGYPVLA